MTNITMQVPIGYAIKENIETLDLDTAAELLCTRKQHKITSARHVEGSEEVAVVSHQLVCPHCGNRIPAYARFLNKHFVPAAEVDKRRPRNEVERWYSRQLTFNSYRVGATRIYNRLIRPKTTFKCPKCGQVSQPDERTREVWITATEQSFELSCEILSLRELTDAEWISHDVVGLTLPAYERIVFCFDTHTTAIELVTKNGGEVLARRDVTLTPERLNNTISGLLVEKNEVVARVLQREFFANENRQNPFTERRLPLKRYVLLTRFRGFNRSFYDAIPFENSSYKIAKSFCEVAKRLQTPASAQQYLKESSLPDIKSVRRAFFTEQGLFFYLPECEKLAAVLNDNNAFCKALKLDIIYDVLSTLHNRPMLIDFLSDYAKVCGAVSLIAKMRFFWVDTKDYAMEYVTLNEEGRKYERKNWKRDDAISMALRKEELHTHPMHRPLESVKDCTILGYRFFWLRTSREYKRRGKELHNCLVGWSGVQNPVVCVEKNGKTVAAIEVHKNVIVQFRGIYNECVQDADCLAAYAKWRERYQLEEDEFLTEF